MQQPKKNMERNHINNSDHNPIGVTRNEPIISHVGPTSTLSGEDNRYVLDALQKICVTLTRMIDTTHNSLEHFEDFCMSSDRRLRYVRLIANGIIRMGGEITYTLSSYLGERSHGWFTIVNDPDISKEYALLVEKDRITIRLPALQSRYSGNEDPYSQMLAATLSRYPNFPQWPIWHASYIHVFPTSYTGPVRDVDNYDYKKCNDVLAFALCTSDSAVRFDMSMTSVFSDRYKPGTYIQITPNRIEPPELPPLFWG